MFNKKYIFLLFIAILITGINCSSHLEKIKAIKLAWKFPILDKELDTISDWNGSSKLFFYQGTVLYEKESFFIHADNTQQKVYTYWMYKQNHKKGIKYASSFQDTLGTKFDVDSFLVKDAFKTFPFYSKEDDSLVFTHLARNKKELIEKYIPKIRPDDSYPDTTVFRYSKHYKDIPFSFSTELEKSKRSKFIEMLGIYNPVTNSKLKAQTQGRKLIIKMEKIPVDNQQEKLLYFNRFKRMIEKLE